MSGIYRTERGCGPPLLCLHGIGSSSVSFEPQLDGLSDVCRVLAWDAPGYRNSQDPDLPLGMSGYASRVAELIVDLGEPVHLLGVSWGGVIACQVALDHPELLRSMILIGASRGSGRTAAGAAAMRARGGELAVRGAEAYAAERAPRLLSPEATPSLVELAITTMATALRLPGYTFAAEAMAGTDLTSRLAEISTSTLVLSGADDVITGPPEGRALAAGINGAAYAPVPGAGHLANQERPDIVNTWIRAHLQIVERLRAEQLAH